MTTGVTRNACRPQRTAGNLWRGLQPAGSRLVSTLVFGRGGLDTSVEAAGTSARATSATYIERRGEIALGEAAGEEREACSEQDRDDPEVELVDQVGFEEVAGELAAAH